jgi:hypothetical protein
VAVKEDDSLADGPGLNLINDFNQALRILCKRRKLKAIASAGLPDFSWYNITKQGKIYQMTAKYPKKLHIKYTKWTENLPNGHKITKIFRCKAIQKLPKLGFLVLK